MASTTGGLAGTPIYPTYANNPTAARSNATDPKAARILKERSNAAAANADKLRRALTNLHRSTRVNFARRAAEEAAAAAANAAARDADVYAVGRRAAPLLPHAEECHRWLG